MKKWRITTLPDAEADIEGIYRYISTTLFEPAIAGNFVARIRKAISSLSQMPERHRLYFNEPWRSKGLRVFPVGNYIVFYHTAPDACTVFIDAVIYGGRDIDEILVDRLD